MMVRRKVMAIAVAFFLMSIAASPAPRAAELTETEDGLVHQPWFMDSFLILGEDLAESHAAGKRFAVLWELKGCPYCREMHRVNFGDAKITDYVKSRFNILQLNIIGSRKVVDFDGEELSEKDLARKWRVKFTPTIQFFPDNGGEDIAEVARMPGYFKPAHFLRMFEYVDDKAYETMTFRQFVRGKPAG